MRNILFALFILIITAFQMTALPTGFATGRLFDNPVVMSGNYTDFSQDDDGFIWIGTNRGLLSFDGNAFDVYRHEDTKEGTLSDSRILHVFCDSKGNIWVATANGLNLYRPSTDTFETVKLPGKNFYGYIEAIGEKSDGSIMFLASGVGLYEAKIKDDKLVAEAFDLKNVGTKVKSMEIGKNGNVYMGTSDGIVYEMDTARHLTRIPVSDGDYIVAMSEEEDGNLLVCTFNDIYRINSKTRKVKKLDINGKISIDSFSNTHNGRIYVSTSDRGLWQIVTGADEVLPSTDIYSPFLDLQKSNIGAVYSAPDGNLWIGCNYRGVVIVPGHQMPFSYTRLTDSFPDFRGGVSAMALWNGNVLAALDKGRIGLFSPVGKLKMSVSMPIDAAVTSIVVSGDKALLGVVGAGVWQLDIPSGKLSKLLDIPGIYPTVRLALGKGDDLFVGVHGEGLLRYNMATGEKNWIPYAYSDEKGFSNPYITSLLNTGDGKLWITTFSGLACYDLNANKMMEVDQMPFLNGTTYAVAPAGGKKLWVGTSQGLILFDPKKGVLKKFTTADGLTDNDVRSIVVDYMNGKWIGTMRGLSYMPPSDDRIFAYYGGYGIVENAFSNGLYSKNDGMVYFGNDMGLTSFDPEKVPSPGFDDRVKVSGLYLNGEPIVPNSKRGSRDVIKGNPISPEAIYLTSSDNALSLRLSTMDFRDSSNISYLWRLHKDDEWIKTPPGESMINIPHLEAGDYDFEVCAFENNSMSEPTRIKIHIAAPWYLTTWAKAFYLLVVLALIVLGLLVLKKKRDEEITEEKIKFFMDISHDLRSPLTLVMSPLESMMKQPVDSDMRVKLETMHRNVNRMLKLVNQLLDIRKIEKGKVQLHCRQTDVNLFVGDLVDMFRPKAEEKNLNIAFEAWDKDRMVWLDRTNFDKIMVNIISNAIKYTPAGGDITVKVSSVTDDKLGECLKVSVADTGIGLDAKTEAKLFERFYRVEKDPAHATIGFGIGLDLCKRLVMLHHGKISGKNREDGVQGSVFTILIPLDESLYKEGELVESDEASADVTGTKADRGLYSHGDTTGDKTIQQPSSQVSGKSILFVDDDAELRSYVSMQLGRTYKVMTASDGEEAMKKIFDHIPDIIISDVMMPGIDGLTLLRRLKSNADTSHVPVIILSSKNDIADRLAGWDKGADGYLGKPFNIDELQMMVATLIENRQRIKGKLSGAHDTEGKIDAPEIKGNDEALMERILKEINGHIDDSDLNVERLASEVGVSRAHLHRRMKELTGMTPSDYIRNIRLKRACELLKKGDVEVTQVAYKVGFASQSHFSTHFKRYTGFTPSEYRSKLQKVTDE